MNEKFRQQYRIPSARASWWNYANAASYFITICTKNREHFFGEILPVETPCMASSTEHQPIPSAPDSNSKTPCMASLRPTNIAKIAEQEWLKTPSIRPDMNLHLDDFIIMPNHFHAIIHIGENNYNGNCRDAMRGVSTGKFGPQLKNLSSIIRGYKSAVTTYARKNNIDFDWQTRFHDYIVRDEKHYNNIRNYILSNPSNWNQHRFNK